MRIYVVQKADVDNQIIGVYDKEGLKAFLKAWRKKGQWSNSYSIDDKGNKKFWCRVKSWTSEDQVTITSYPLNKAYSGMCVRWPFQTRR